MGICRFRARRRRSTPASAGSRSRSRTCRAIAGRLPGRCAVAVVESALELCGYSIWGEGRVAPIPVTDETPKPKQRIVLGAMRILTRFDRLSIMEQRVRQRFERLRSKRRNQMRKGDAPGVTWEFLTKVCEMVEEDARQRARRAKAAFVPRTNAIAGGRGSCRVGCSFRLGWSLVLGW